MTTTTPPWHGPPTPPTHPARPPWAPSEAPTPPAWAPSHPTGPQTLPSIQEALAAQDAAQLAVDQAQARFQAARVELDQAREAFRVARTGVAQAQARAVTNAGLLPRGATGLTKGSQKAAIMAALAAGTKGTAKDLGDVTGLARHLVAVHLCELTAGGRIQRMARGLYAPW